MVIVPIEDNIVIKLDKEEKEQVTNSGIVIANVNKNSNVNTQDKGTVVAIGSGRLLSDGSKIESSLNVGDYVLFNKFAGTRIENDGNSYLILKENDILAILYF